MDPPQKKRKEKKKEAVIQNIIIKSRDSNYETKVLLMISCMPSSASYAMKRIIQESAKSQRLACLVLLPAIFALNSLSASFSANLRFSTVVSSRSAFNFSAAAAAAASATPNAFVSLSFFACRVVWFVTKRCQRQSKNRCLRHVP